MSPRVVSPGVGVVLTTHNSSDHIDATLASIADQTLLPTQVLVVDDHSTDGTVPLVLSWARRLQAQGVELSVQGSTANDDNPEKRIGRNFTQGLRALADLDLVALGDHDDVWFPQRVEEQVSLMTADPGAVMLASNGVIEGLDSTLFEAFDVPSSLEVDSPREVLRFTIRHSVATGGASMVRPGSLLRSGVLAPPGDWLHDRWWSLVAATQAGLRVSFNPVLNYRVGPDQAVGLSRGRQTSRGISRWRSAHIHDLARVRALHRLKAIANPDVQRELRWDRLLRSVL